jgi:hypothetical protein
MPLGVWEFASDPAESFGTIHMRRLQIHGSHVGSQTLSNYVGSGGQGGVLNPLYQIGGPRSIQLALKLQF